MSGKIRDIKGHGQGTFYRKGVGIMAAKDGQSIMYLYNGWRLERYTDCRFDKRHSFNQSYSSLSSNP